MVTDIGLFFEPVNSVSSESFNEGSIGRSINKYEEGKEFPELTKGSVAIFGVTENRRSDSNQSVAEDLVAIRKQFYQLQNHFGSLQLFDLGNIAAGQTVEDTYYAVTNSVAAVIKKGGIAVILGGGQDLTCANYLAYEQLEQVVNLVSVDSRFDLGGADDAVSSTSYLQKVIVHQPNILFNYSNVGFQTHHVKPSEVDLLKKMYFDTYRLGEVQADLSHVEPVIRNADLVSFDLTSIRSADYPSNYRSEPNGLYGEQACAIARYAGISDKTTSVGFYECHCDAGNDSRSASLVAQMVWYFVWGVYSRKGDYPFAGKEEYTKFTVALKDGKYDVVFYKSARSDRWWMEVPYPTTRGQKYERHFMVPCNYDDYLKACEDEVPDRWWETYQKLG